ncbi:hypothetical protein DT076_02905 [Desertihabitans brevis]|uniref:Uncharacterized protein n=1 Tax=Desertihabitans brevis TaxID=2268447 RepID=A0A367YZV8_9ACTN|nr:hypothetical protein [Desertihabitans brevis]RCK71384.1 hypothetical protein DT076_02905 [Desertihabitans brevis]
MPSPDQLSAHPSVPAPRSRWARVLRVVLVVLAVLLALPVLAYVGNGVVGSVRQARLAREVAAEVRDGRAVAEPEVRALRDRQRAAVAAAGGPPPRHSHLALECQLGTRDAGWIVQEHTQTCSVRSIDLHPVADRAAADALVARLAAADFGEPTSSPLPDGCVALRKRSEADLPEVETLWVPAAAVADDRCYQLRTAGADGTAGETFALEDLEPGQDWVAVVTTRTVLPERGIGCSPWSVLFCTAPWDEPVRD